MKLFSLSTILGLAFGISLIAYGVFAFTPPDADPPEANISAPLNVGSATQEKTGGIRSGGFRSFLDSYFDGKVGIGTTDPKALLDVNGRVRVGRFAAKPSCSTDTLGSFVFDTVNDRPYVCASGNTWKPLDSDFDKDGLIEWLDPDDNSFNPTCSADNGGQCYLSQTSKSALDGDLAAGNIVKGVNIFGVLGNLEPKLTELITFKSANSWTPTDGWKDLRHSPPHSGNPTSFTIPPNAKSWACSYGAGSGAGWASGGNVRIMCGGTEVHYKSFIFASVHEPLLGTTGILTGNIGGTCKFEGQAWGGGVEQSILQIAGGCYAVE
jgi:hypothetical protein